MPSNLRILYNSTAWDAGTITESSDITSRRGPNAVLDHPGKSWITSTDTGEWWKNDLGSAIKLTCIGIFGHNLTSAATVTLQAHTSDSWGAPAYEVQLTLATDVDGNVLPRIVFCFDETYRWWRIYINDATNPDEKIQIARIMAGQFYEMVRQPARGLRVTEKDPSAIEHVGGSIDNYDDLEEKGRFRQIRPAFPWRSMAERRKWQAIFRHIGNVKPCVLMLDYDNYPSEQSAYCWLISDLDWVWEHSQKYDVMQLLFEEKTR